MKKLLTILSAFALTATGASTVVACGDKEEGKEEDPKPNTELTAKEKAVTTLASFVADVKVADDKKTATDVEAEIKKAINTLLNDNEVKITELTVKVGDVKLEDKDVKDGELKVSGKLQVGTTEEGKAEFTLKKVTLKIVTATQKHKEDANNAVKALTGLKGVTFKFADLGATGKADKLNALLLKDPKILAIITGDVKVESGKFTLKVGKVAADDTTLIDKAVVTVSGKIEVKGEKSDSDFTFEVKIEDTVKLTDLAGLSNVTITSEKTVADFSAKLIDELKKQTGFDKLEIAHVELLKEDGSAGLEVGDIVASTVVKVKAKTSDKLFSNEKNVTVTWTVKP